MAPLTASQGAVRWGGDITNLIKSMNKIGIATLIFLVGAGLIGLYVGLQKFTMNGFSFQGGNGGLTAAKCSVNTVTAAPIGDDVSLTVLAANETRAWAEISLETLAADGVATNTPRLSFDEGAAATLNDGRKLSTSTPTIVFGRNTDFPYTGAVTGITNTGSTTVRVTECTY